MRYIVIVIGLEAEVHFFKDFDCATRCYKFCAKQQKYKNRVLLVTTEDDIDDDVFYDDDFFH